MMIHDDFAKQNAVNCSFGIQGVRTHELNDCIRDRLVLDALAVASKCCWGGQELQVAAGGCDGKTAPPCDPISGIPLQRD